LLGRYQQSQKDIDVVLNLEKRHFGALSGQGLVQTELKNYEKAINSYKEVQKIYPSMQAPKVMIPRLKELIKDQSIWKNLWYNLNIMNVFIILSILIIVIGVLLIVATPSVLFKFNWNEKTGLEKILVILFYCILLYIINIKLIKILYYYFKKIYYCFNIYI